MRKAFIVSIGVLLFVMMIGCPGAILDDENENNGSCTLPCPPPLPPQIRPDPSLWPNFVPQPLNDPDTSTIKNTAANFDESGNFVEWPRIIHEAWINVTSSNADPRNVLGYRLVNSDKRFFDRVVLSSAVLGWDHIDLNSPDPFMPLPERSGWCPRNDVHLCIPPALQWLLADHAKFIQPLKDAGMEVLVGITGGNQGICFATIGDWPHEDGNARWNDDPDSGGRFGNWEDIMGTVGARRMAKELVEFLKHWGFDGIAIDDISCNVRLPFSGPRFGLRNHACREGANERGGENIFRWLAYFKDMSRTPERPGGMIVTLISDGNVRQMPGYLKMESVDWQGNIMPPRIIKINEIVDGLTPGRFGIWHDTIQPVTVGCNRTARFSVSFAFEEIPGFFDIWPPRPCFSVVKGFTGNLMRGGHGLIMYFGLTYRAGNNISQPNDNLMSLIAEVLYRDGVWFSGHSYPRFPVQRRGSTHGTGALFHPDPPFGVHPRYFARYYF